MPATAKTPAAQLASVIAGAYDSAWWEHSHTESKQPPPASKDPAVKAAASLVQSEARKALAFERAARRTSASVERALDGIPDAIQREKLRRLIGFLGDCIVNEVMSQVYAGKAALNHIREYEASCHDKEFRKELEDSGRRIAECARELEQSR